MVIPDAGEDQGLAMIYVSPLPDLAKTAALCGARYLLTLSQGQPIPQADAFRHHVHVEVADLECPSPGLIMPDIEHVRSILTMARDWDPCEPLLICCRGGISRSTAAAFIVACFLDATGNESDLAWELRQRSPSAKPNRLLVAYADRLLRRDGRMLSAVREIGRGDASEGKPFHLAIGLQKSSDGDQAGARERSA